MRYSMVKWRAAVVVALGTVVAWQVGRAVSAAEAKSLPPFEDVEQIVVKHFEKVPGHRPGDLIVQGEVKPLFGRLQRAGWQVADRKLILEKVPTSGEFLARQLRTPSGRKFMRGIGTTPDTYDRLERLSRMPYGKLTIRRLIPRHGGAEVFTYLAADPDGIKASQLQARNMKSPAFDKPTGRIYTAEMLLDRLRESHAAAKQQELEAKQSEPASKTGVPKADKAGKDAKKPEK